MGLAELVDEFKRVVGDTIDADILDRYARVTGDPYETISNMLTLSYVVDYLVVECVAKYKSWVKPSKPLVEIHVARNSLPENIVGDLARVLSERAETSIAMAIENAKKLIAPSLMLPFEVNVIVVMHNHRSEVEKAIDYMRRLLGRVNARVTPDFYCTHLVGVKEGVVSLYSGQHRTKLDVLEQVMDKLGYDSREEVKPLAHYKRIVHYTKKFGNTIIWIDGDDKGFGFIRACTKLTDRDNEVLERLDTALDFLKNRAQVTVANITIENIEVSREIEEVVREVNLLVSELNQV